MALDDLQMVIKLYFITIILISIDLGKNWWSATMTRTRNTFEYSILCFMEFVQYVSDGKPHQNILFSWHNAIDMRHKQWLKIQQLLMIWMSYEKRWCFKKRIFNGSLFLLSLSHTLNTERTIYETLLGKGSKKKWTKSMTFPQLNRMTYGIWKSKRKQQSPKRQQMDIPLCFTPLCLGIVLGFVCFTIFYIFHDVSQVVTRSSFIHSLTDE